jgi:hypothetical protein
MARFPKLEMRNCLHCNMLFQPRESKIKFCSHPCYVSHYRGKPRPKKWRENIAKALRGKKRPEEVKKKVSETRRLRCKLGLIVPWNKGRKGVQKSWIKGLDKSDPRIKKIMKKRTWVYAHKKLKQLFQNPKWKSWWLKRSINAHAVKPNKLETKLIVIIEKCGFPLTYVGDGQVTIGGKCPDFIESNGGKKIVEVFGEYWHKRSNMPWHQTQEGTLKVYRQYGYDCLILWENEVATASQQELQQKLEEFLER